MKVQSLIVCMGIYLAAALLTFTVSSCGKAGAAAPPSAALIMGPPGYTCFAISSGGEVVSGNCIKE